MILIISLLLLGCLVGLSSSLLGLGGNIFIIPIMPLLLEMPLVEVIATGIFTVFFITLVNSIFFIKKGLIDFKVATLLALPTFIFSYVGSKASFVLSEQELKLLLIIILIAMLLKLNFEFTRSQNTYSRKSRNFLLLASGTFSGTLAGACGIGSGVILGPILLGFKLIDSKKVSPTINLMIMIACFSASIHNLSLSELTSVRSGLVRLDYSLLILTTAFFTSWLGRKQNSIISDRSRKLLITIILILFITKLIVFN